MKRSRVILGCRINGQNMAGITGTILKRPRLPWLGRYEVYLDCHLVGHGQVMIPGFEKSLWRWQFYPLDPVFDRLANAVDELTETIDDTALKE
jgi:hypothetical protein